MFGDVTDENGTKCIEHDLVVVLNFTKYQSKA